MSLPFSYLDSHLFRPAQQGKEVSRWTTADRQIKVRTLANPAFSNRAEYMDLLASSFSQDLHRALDIRSVCLWKGLQY